MSWPQHKRKKSFLAFTVGLGVLLWSSAPIRAEEAGLTELYAGIRENTVRYIALGTPGDLIRLQDAFYRTERELAKLLLDIPSEGSAQLANQQQTFKDLKDRLAESQDFRRLLDRPDEKAPIAQLPLMGAEEWNAIRKQISGRVEALRGAIDSVEEAIRSEEAAHILTLIDERKALANLLEKKRLELLTEYSKWLECQVADRSCLHQRLRILCEIRLLSSGAERLHILRLIADVDSRLNAGGQIESTSCDSL
ncbi:MAG: hypothetical protein KGL31_09410 [candidate division NC10 bacterium]|nr:hypothetical protein [candidate division NC10 bacterium]MDE2322116.1 hypothetical protein [candidate division NC10 bacterium]